VLRAAATISGWVLWSVFSFLPVRPIKFLAGNKYVIKWKKKSKMQPTRTIVDRRAALFSGNFPI
jgi:hypothetical protein